MFIVLYVLDIVNLVNKYKFDICDCCFVVVVWGDLSSEWMMGCIDILICIIDGEIVEM